MKPKTTNLDMDIEKVLMEDEAFKEGTEQYERIMEQAQSISEEITSALITAIVKKTDTGDKANTLTLSTAILSAAKTLINLSSYVYDNESDFMNTIKEAREAVIDKIIPAMLNPQPCGLCQECKSKKPCTNPNMDTNLLQTKSLPIVSASLIEYDLWNKMMYIYTEGINETSEDENK